mgnify:CR=1 FL=1
MVADEEDIRQAIRIIIGTVPGRGFKTAMKVLEKGRIHIAAVAVGVAKRMLRDALQALKRRQGLRRAFDRDKEVVVPGAGHDAALCSRPVPR